MVKTFNTVITPYGLTRNVFLWLPDDWQTSGRRYPVTYMFDGHNLFYNETATYGTCWGLLDYCQAHPDQIIAAPECNHEGNGRLEEYSPYDLDAFGGIHGTGRQYLDWLTREFKPALDAAYPTLPDRAHTAIAGSSMGGLMSLYAVTAYNAVFSRAACLSPSVRFCMEPLRRDLANADLRPDTRIFLSWGEQESDAPRALAHYTANALEVCRALLARGADVCPYLQLGGRHCEASWAEQVPLYSRYLWEDRHGRKEE